jgi:hypothetical protein
LSEGFWNYRLIRHHYPEAIFEDEKELIELHEVYYNLPDNSLRACRACHCYLFRYGHWGQGGMGYDERGF